jgi:hypothetical protein
LAAIRARNGIRATSTLLILAAEADLYVGVVDEKVRLGQDRDQV